jgi:hypothetical protein
MQRVNVIIPSRTQPQQAGFLNRALKSVSAQSARQTYTLEVVIGLDPEAATPELEPCDIPVRWARAAAKSQAAALNGAAAAAQGDFIAFLEDDDLWHASHLAVALPLLANCGFVSTTQLEIDPQGNVVRINDFPTPSGWVMPRSTWEAVGEFNPRFRYHLDNEWLGRLAERSIERVHVADATAPTNPQVARQVRPWLANVAQYGGTRVRFARHQSPVPNVLRLVHPGSGMYQLVTDAAQRKQSEAEMQELHTRFGRIPW